MSENVILDFKKLKLSPKEISFSYSSLVRHAIYYIELCLYRLSYKLYKKYSYGRLCPFMCPYDHGNIHEHIFWALKSTTKAFSSPYISLVLAEIHNIKLRLHS